MLANPFIPTAATVTDLLSPLHAGEHRLFILDQTRLPFTCCELELRTAAQVHHAIAHMQVRGAPLIGAVGAFGLALALREAADDAALRAACEWLGGARPTAVNLHWALRRTHDAVLGLPPAQRAAAAWQEALAIVEQDRADNAAIGRHGLHWLRQLAPRGERINIMTHCNAGWLATTGHGTALAPVYAAHAAGLPVHVWVSETRPRNQGLLTAWELRQAGVAHTLLADNAAAELMRRGQVDALIVGADRIAANGDTANKVGTCLKALAAAAHALPFLVAAPWTTFDWNCADGSAIPIEERDADEMRLIATGSGPARLCEGATAIANPAFDITAAALIRAFITPSGVISPQGIQEYYPQDEN